MAGVFDEQTRILTVSLTAKRHVERIIGGAMITSWWYSLRGASQSSSLEHLFLDVPVVELLIWRFAFQWSRLEDFGAELALLREPEHTGT